MNAFVELCKIASKENWCWKIFCTTCGHGNFRWGFIQIAEGVMPGPEWQERSHEAPRHFDLGQMDALIKICMEADLNELAKECRFPDWLGYLGLVIHHCRRSELFPKLSEAWANQLSEMLTEGSRLKESLKSSQILTIRDLEYVESELPR